MNKYATTLFLGLFFAVVFYISIATRADADVSVGNGGNGRLPAQYRIIQASGSTSIANARVFVGVSNLNTSTQINNVTCYDNASAASGNIIYNGIVGITPPIYPDDGIALVNGLTCTIPISLLGQGVAIYFR